MNLKYKSISIAIILAMTGCNKKLLDKKPLGVIDDASFYKTDGDMVKAVNAAYDPLGWESANGTNKVFFNFFFGDIASDDAYAGGNGSEIRIVPYATFTVNSRDEGLLELWRKYYIGIYRTNLVIAKAPESSASPAIKSRVAGEAKFLRAYYHFKLIQMFGDVPVITKLLKPDEYNQPKSPKSVVYAQIEADLNDAIGALPVSYGGADMGRITKGAAYGLLARVSMFQQKWAETRDAANGVLSLGVYSLEPEYTNIHLYTNKNGKESIFEFQTNTSVTTEEERLNEGAFINKYVGARDQGGFGVNVPSDELAKFFDDNAAVWGKEDPRKKGTIISNGDVVQGNVITSMVDGAPRVPGIKYYTRKYYIGEKVFTGTQTNGPSGQIIIRLADVYLMAAEAYYNLGDEPNALKNVNIVRERVKMPVLTAATYNGLKLKEAIWAERRLELSMESHRFFDLVRQGRAAEVIKATQEGKNFIKGKNEVFPIPQTEIDLSGGLLIQNPLY